MRVISSLVVMLLAALLLSGCIVHSDNPITDKDARYADTHLTGRWVSDRGNGELEPLIADISAKKDGAVTVTLSHLKMPDDVMRLEGHLSHAGKNRFMNLKIVDMGMHAANGFQSSLANSPEDQWKYILVRYTFGTDNNHLKIWTLFPENLEAVPGLAFKSGNDRSLRLLGSSKELRAFFAKPPAGIYRQGSTWTRS